MNSLFRCVQFLASRRTIISSKLCSKLKTSKSFSTSKVRKSQDFQQEGIPGASLPFCIHGGPILTLKMAVFFSVAFNAPFLITRHALLANAQPGEGQQYGAFQETTLTVCKEVSGPARWDSDESSQLPRIQYVEVEMEEDVDDDDADEDQEMDD